MNLDRAYAEGRELVHGGGKIVFFTGAGLGADSGIPTFRGQDGLWKGFRAEELATPGAFQADPDRVWEWYRWRRGLIGEAQPHEGHRAIADAIQRDPRGLAVTQNVDGMHQRSGVPGNRVVELHGNIWIDRCQGCGQEKEVAASSEVVTGPLPRCGKCGDLCRPGVVWFGEGLPVAAWERAERDLEAANGVLVVGTSAVVQPAASLVGRAAHAGAWVIEVNPEPALGATPLFGARTVALAETAARALPRLLDP